MTQATITDYETERRRQEELEQEKLQEELELQREAAQAQVSDQIDLKEEEYLSAAETIALQRELELRDIRETRANSGLSRSGLLATEQRGVTLSAERRTAAARRSKQLAVEALKQSLADYETELARIEQEEATAITAAADSDIEAYKNELTTRQAEEEAARQAEEEKAREAEEEKAAAMENARRTALKAVYDNGALDAYTYGLAVDNGWTITQALEYQNNKNKLGAMLEDGTIDEATHDEAVKNGYTAESVEKAAEYEKQLSEIAAAAKKMMQREVTLKSGRTRMINTPNGIHAAITYLYMTGLTAEEIKRIGDTIGLTNADFEGYVPKQTSTTSRTDVSVATPGSRPGNDTPDMIVTTAETSKKKSWLQKFLEDYL